MAIIVTSGDPRKLLANIKEAIDRGSVETWKYDSDGDFTHSPAQWNRQAWFRPLVESDGLVFVILAPRNTTMSKTIYGVYHGRFIEMLLTHFDLGFSRVLATALPERGDIVKSS